MHSHSDISFNINNVSDFERITVKKSKGNVTGQLGLLTFKDKDTKQFVFVVPSLSMSSYGSTQAKAKQMLGAEIHTFFVNLLQLKPEQITRELKKLGWIKNSMRAKQYSKAYVGIDGTLQNFNAQNEVKMSLMQLGAVA